MSPYLRNEPCFDLLVLNQTTRQLSGAAGFVAKRTELCRAIGVFSSSSLLLQIPPQRSTRQKRFCSHDVRRFPSFLAIKEAKPETRLRNEVLIGEKSFEALDAGVGYGNSFGRNRYEAFAAKRLDVLADCPFPQPGKLSQVELLLKKG